MCVNGKTGYYTGLQSGSRKKVKDSWINGFRITDKLEKIPKSGRFLYRFMDWGDGSDSSRDCWWSTFPNELEFTINLLKNDLWKPFNITDIKVLDVDVQSEKLELTK